MSLTRLRFGNENSDKVSHIKCDRVLQRPPFVLRGEVVHVHLDAGAGGQAVVQVDRVQMLKNSYGGFSMQFWFVFLIHFYVD